MLPCMHQVEILAQMPELKNVTVGRGGNNYTTDTIDLGRDLDNVTIVANPRHVRITSSPYRIGNLRFPNLQKLTKTMKKGLEKQRMIENIYLGTGKHTRVSDAL